MIIVNFSTREYLRAQGRLENSVGHYVPFMKLQSYESIGSPTHQDSPYEFKIHAMKAASQVDPIVLWCDSSLYRVGDLSKIEDIIKRDGYFMEEAGHYVGTWCNGHTYDYFKLTEQEAKQGEGGMIMFSAGLLGLDFNNPLAMSFFEMWHASALAGCFAGQYANHRHDMTCGSIIAQRLGMKYQRGGSHMSYIGPGYSTPEEGTVFYLQGMQ